MLVFNKETMKFVVFNVSFKEVLTKYRFRQNYSRTLFLKSLLQDFKGLRLGDHPIITNDDLYLTPSHYDFFYASFVAYE